MAPMVACFGASTPVSFQWVMHQFSILQVSHHEVFIVIYGEIISILHAGSLFYDQDDHHVVLDIVCPHGRNCNADTIVENQVPGPILSVVRTF